MRGKCSVCGFSVRVRRDGTAMAHKLYPPDEGRRCEGSGQPAKRAEKSGLPPNWSAASHMHGGHLREIPLPHVRFFPGPRRRKVRVFPSRVFHHYHTSMKLEDNPIWNSETGTWQLAWDDDAGRSPVEFKILNTLTEVTMWVEKMIRTKYPRRLFEIVDEFGSMSGDDPKWLKDARDAAYRASRREGD